MSVAPAVLLDGTCVVPLHLNSSGGNRVWQVTADGRMGVGQVDMSSAGLTMRVKGDTITNVYLDNPSTAFPATIVIEDAADPNLFTHFAMYPSGVDGSNLSRIPLSGQVRAGSGLSGGLVLVATNSAASVILAAGGAALTARKWQVTPAGHLLPYGSLNNIGDSSNRAATLYAVNIDMTGALTGQINSAGDLIVNNAARGLVLKSANGHYWRLTADNAGSLLTADLGTSLPT